MAALDLAAARGVPLEWIATSGGARIAMDSGTENLDATARVVRRIVEFTAAGGEINVIVAGVNVGAQSYFNALATMLLSHARRAGHAAADASMVLTGRLALEASGGVGAEDEVAIGGFERIMGPNGQAQYYARDLARSVRRSCCNTINSPTARRASGGRGAWRRAIRQRARSATHPTRPTSRKASRPSARSSTTPPIRAASAPSRCVPSCRR